MFFQNRFYETKLILKLNPEILMVWYKEGKKYSMRCIDNNKYQYPACIRKQDWQRGLCMAVKKNDMKNILYFGEKGNIEEWNRPFNIACEMGNKEVMNYFFSKNNQAYYVYTLPNRNHHKIPNIIDCVNSLPIKVTNITAFMYRLMSRKYHHLIQYMNLQNKNGNKWYILLNILGQHPVTNNELIEYYRKNYKNLV